MPEKKSKNGTPYRIDGKRFVWTANAEDPDDDFPAFEVTLPLRLRLSVVLDSGADADMTSEQMMSFIEKLIPKQAADVREMDVNDFQEMFLTWQHEYSTLSGSSVGESGGSST